MPSADFVRWGDRILWSYSEVPRRQAVNGGRPLEFIDTPTHLDLALICYGQVAVPTEEGLRADEQSEAGWGPAGSGSRR